MQVRDEERGGDQTIRERLEIDRRYDGEANQQRTQQDHRQRRQDAPRPPGKEAAQRKPSGIQVPEQAERDHETGNDEKHVAPGKPAGKPGGA